MTLIRCLALALLSVSVVVGKNFLHVPAGNLNRLNNGLYSQNQIDLGQDMVDLDMKIKLPGGLKGENEKGRSRRAVITNEFLKWPKGIVPYKFSTEFPVSTSVKTSTVTAMEYIMQKTCIRFVERTTETDYVSIAAEKNECYSYVGRIGGAQELNLGNVCFQVGVAIHELLHALGFLHEHNRPDRDSFVNVKFENIKSDDKSCKEDSFLVVLGAERSFEKFTLESYGGVSLSNIPYDRQSVMHYYNFAFTNKSDFVIFNDQNDMTIVSTGPQGALERLGNDRMSEKDIQRVNLRYSCPLKPTEKPTLPVEPVTPKQTLKPIITEQPISPKTDQTPLPKTDKTASPKTDKTASPKTNKTPTPSPKTDNTPSVDKTPTLTPSPKTEETPPPTPCVTKDPKTKWRKKLKEKEKKDKLKAWWKKMISRVSGIIKKKRKERRQKKKTSAKTKVWKKVWKYFGK